MVFNDLRVFYQTVYPKDEGSPLILDIDETKTLRLKYNQNIFSLRVSDINYDYPSLILYSWKLEGFYEHWSRPGEENVIRFTNLSPGEYTFRIHAISNEDSRIVLKERGMQHHYCGTHLAQFLGDDTLCNRTCNRLPSSFCGSLLLRNERKESDKKIHFFINTAHDIRTPLTLIKAPGRDTRTRSN